MTAQTAKHTPGPWIVNMADGDIRIVADTFETVADVRAMYGVDRANARLIAAAPSLLEALRELLGPRPAIKQGDHDPVAAARAAIKLAEGI